MAARMIGRQAAGDFPRRRDADQQGVGPGGLGERPDDRHVAADPQHLLSGLALLGIVEHRHDTLPPVSNHAARRFRGMRIGMTLRENNESPGHVIDSSDAGLCGDLGRQAARWTYCPRRCRILQPRMTRIHTNEVIGKDATLES